MALVYRDHEIPAGTICTERLYDMIRFKEYKGFIFKCRLYCSNRNINIDEYIDMPASLTPGWKKIYFLPIDLAIGIIENVRMSNRNRGTTLEYLYSLKGEKIHIQLQERKATEFVEVLQSILQSFGIDSIREYHCNTYRIDLYIPAYNIAVEYDEYHHTVRNDTRRELELRQALSCTFIRVSSTTDIASELSTVLTEVLTRR